ncbi:unnamed protein product [Blepharisma stoltei]|uniref:phenylalanine 4-monooxygenase n=1 Tax=Blepharisma stoltei TaxID=1481888 RepID=A0AAU9JB25_9CILI|nr:unnamed protein product [Blepharisma stoltei]
MAMKSLLLNQTKQLFTKPIWYPRSRRDLDCIDKSHRNIIDDLGNSYPGSNDIDYMNWLSSMRNYDTPADSDVPDAYYPEQANKTWNILYGKLKELHSLYACDEHNQNLIELENKNIYTENEVPQFSKVNNWLNSKTGFKLVPVGGMINARSFLYGLAYRVFFASRYIRHISSPFYAVEPDVVHDLMGHVPLFANEEMAEFSQEIGKKSLGASDEKIDQLAKIYYYSVEFGVIGEKILGAGILSSSGEIINVGEKKCKVEPWELKKVLNMDYVLHDFQPLLFKANSLTEMKKFVFEAVES